MKRVVLLLVSLALLLSLAACGSPKAPNELDVEATNQPEPSPEITQPPADVPNSEPPAQTEPPKKEITFTEFIAVDNDKCSIKITGFNPIDDDECEIKAEYENKSAAETFKFYITSSAINGVWCENNGVEELGPGQQIDTVIQVSKSVFDEIDVGDFTDIELCFEVYNSDHPFQPAAAYETVHIYPYGEEEAVTFVREAMPTDHVIVDNESFSVIVTGYEKNVYMDYITKVFLVNKTDKAVRFDVLNTSLNGQEIDSLIYHSIVPILAGSCAFSEIVWDYNDLKAAGITEVNEIELTVKARDDYDLYAPEYLRETVIFNP